MQMLIGIVASGGKSSRMHQDKSRISYHGKQQQYFLYEMLSKICDAVYISCNKRQATVISPAYTYIQDEEIYAETGPMAALLSAYKKFPEASFLLVGCDYPFLKQNDLKKLIGARKEEGMAVCFFNPRSEMEEPLVALYENSCMNLLLKKFEENKLSLRHFLQEVNATRIEADNSESIISVDTPLQLADYTIVTNGLRLNQS